MAEPDLDPAVEPDPQGGQEPQEPASILDDSDPQPPALPPDAFPENWREQMAGDNESLMNQLARFSSPAMLAKAFGDTRKMISDGTYSRSLAADATDEEISAWRTEHGIPAEASGYELDLGDMVLPDGDEELVGTFKEIAHAANFTPAQVNEAVKWYASLAETNAAHVIETDNAFRQEAMDELRQEWGPEFRANVNAAKGYFPEHLAPVWATARTADGTLLGNHPEFLRLFAQRGREMNPASTIPIPNANNITDVETRRAEIEKMMGNPKSDYWEGPLKDKIQEEYRTIITYMERAK